MRPSASMKHPNSIKKLTKLTNVNEEKKTVSIFFTRGQPSEKNYFFGVAVDRGFQQQQTFNKKYYLCVQR